MAYFDDLSECSYFEYPQFPRSIAVGWLEIGRSFVSGDPGSEVRRRLDEFREANWHLTAYFGGHDCDLCPTSEDLPHWPARDTYFETDLFIPGPGVLYATPVGICHYVKKHRYHPPSASCEALRWLPRRTPQNTSRLLQPTSGAAGLCWCVTIINAARG